MSPENASKPSPSTKARRLSWPAIVIPAALGVVLVVTAALFVTGMLRPYAFHGMVLQSPEPAIDFTLTSHQGQGVSLSDFHGQVVLLFFGYTSCPDVCPTTLSRLNRALSLLGPHRKDVQVLMITVDPERDTADTLAEYLEHFNSSFLGLTGDPEKIAEIATYYGVFFESRESDSVLGYEVQHTATTMLIDREGFPRLVFPFGTSPEDLAADLKYVLNR